MPVDPGDAPPRSSLLPALLLAVVFIAAKTASVWPVDGIGTIPAFSAEDVALALGFGLLGGAALRASASRRRLHRAVWVTLLLAGVVAALYALASVGIYHALRQPLNLRMLRLVHRLSDMRSSLVEHCNLGLVAAMLLTPLVYIGLAQCRFAVLARRGVQVGIVLLALAWIGTGKAFSTQAGPDGWHGRALKNPHRELVVSIISDLLLNRRLELGGSFPEEYREDFKLAGQRPALPRAYPAPPRNIIVVVLESTGAEYLSLYGSRFDTTPRLAAESRHALLFDRFYANIGYTFCSMMPLFYSIYPGLPWHYQPSEACTLPAGLAMLLKGRGHRTAFFSAADPQWGGMDYMAQKAGCEDVFGPDQLGGRMASSWGAEDGALFDSLIRWIDADTKRPFFAVAWTDQSHDPYTLSKDTRPVDFLDESKMQRGELLERYLNTLRQVDGHLGRLFDALRSRDLADDTLVVIVGDHGEAFGEYHNAVGHGGALFQESLRVPLMLWNPRLFPSPQRNARAGSHVDLLPTLAHMLGLDPAPRWQGVSLFSKDHPGRAYLQADLSGYQFGVADDRYKYMLYVTEGFERLYDLQQDPREQRDLAGHHPAIVSQMRGRVSAFIRAEEAYLQGK